MARVVARQRDANMGATRTMRLPAPRRYPEPELCANKALSLVSGVCRTSDLPLQLFVAFEQSAGTSELRLWQGPSGVKAGTESDRKLRHILATCYVYSCFARSGAPVHFSIRHRGEGTGGVGGPYVHSHTGS